MNFTNGNGGPHTHNASAFEVLQRFADYHIRLLKVRARGKEAVEKNWQTVANYAISDSEIQAWVIHGGNYGVMCPTGFCCLVDADTLHVQDALENNLPQTFRYSTGKTGHFQYVYYIEDQPIGCVPLKDGAYIKGKGGYALGPGSVHPNGVIYGSREIREVPIAVVKRETLLAAVKPFLIAKMGTQSKSVTVPVQGSGKLDPDKIVEALTHTWMVADGMRHQLTLAISGSIKWSGGTSDQSEYVILELIRITGKGSEHATNARSAFTRESAIYGFPTLRQIMEATDDQQR